MLPFKDIYKKAIDLFDDPIIQRAYVEDTVRWEKLMYPYLLNGVDQFTNPTSISMLLQDVTPPSGQIEVFEGNGGATYSVSGSFVPQEGSDLSFIAGGRYDKGAVFENGTVTFSKEVPIGAKCSIEWYFPGCFNTDFSSASTSTVSGGIIKHNVESILARAVVLTWATNEQNFLLDIKNVLTDSDFKVYSPANSIKAKVEWVEKIRMEHDTLMTNFGWALLSRKYHGGRFYG